MIETTLSLQNDSQEQFLDFKLNTQAKRILLVEDDADLREMLGETLEDLGHVAFQAASRKEALMILEMENPDLILLDVMLPDGDGLDICRRTAGRENNYNPATVFVLSGRTSLECKLQSFLAGAKRFFAKPFEMDDLIEAIDRTVPLKNNPPVPF